ncbi:MAG: 2-C-methyl-D-erythritol 4-phosphate cytidylyltransferase [Bacillota bacterium]|nr:2-C-methyl-D-erythritol 4-phosphate cytidylyltransferase [Bacillota bacterium]
MKVAAIIAAAGEGLRMGSSTRKQYLLLEGVPVIVYSVKLFLGHPAVKEIIIVVPPGEKDAVKALIRTYYSSGQYILVEGGETRQESISLGLEAVSIDIDLVAVHDAARPLATADLLNRLVEAAAEKGAVVPVISLNDTAKEIDPSGYIISTPDREKLRLVQTPQVFRREILVNAYQEASRKGHMATDDASLVELSGAKVLTILGEVNNLKLTSPRDLELAAILMRGLGEKCTG